MWIRVHRRAASRRARAAILALALIIGVAGVAAGVGVLAPSRAVAAPSLVKAWRGLKLRVARLLTRPGRLHLVHGLPGSKVRAVPKRLGGGVFRRASRSVGAIYDSNAGNGAAGDAVDHHTAHAGTVFLLRAPNGSSAGLVMTNHHVVNQSSGSLERTLRFENGKQTTLGKTAKVVWSDPALDVAIVSFTTKQPLPRGVHALPLVRAGPTDKAQKLRVLGYAALDKLPFENPRKVAAVGRGFAKLSQQRVTGRGEDGLLQGTRIATVAKSIGAGFAADGGRIDRRAGDPPTLSLAVKTLPGMSGSPVLDKAGGVVGLQWARETPTRTSHGHALVVPMNKIIDSLSRSDPSLLRQLSVR